MDIIYDLETDGVNPLKDRITAIGIKTADEEKIITHKDEKRILEEFWAFLSNKDFRLIGFNNQSFDDRFIIIRSFRHNIKVVDLKSRSMDLRLILGGKHSKGTLEEYSRMIGHKENYNGFTGSHISLLWQRGDIKELREYLMQDALMTYAIYIRLKEMGCLS